MVFLLDAKDNVSNKQFQEIREKKKLQELGGKDRK